MTDCSRWVLPSDDCSAFGHTDDWPRCRRCGLWVWEYDTPENGETRPKTHIKD